MSKLVLIDGNAIMHRAYHALPRTFRNKKGEPTNAVYGFVSMLLKVITDLEPTHLAICFDRKEPTFRKKLLEDYQAHRPEMDADLGEQFPKAKEVASAMGIPLYEKAGFEADDVIGTISKKAKTKNVVIVTGDKDILQLVDEKIKVYLPKKGLSDAQLMGRDEVVKKLGVRPERVDDYKALVGDPSDNYKGVHGIGPKTAVNLIEKYDDLKGIYKNLDKLPESLIEKLRSGEESAKMSFKLAQIVTNVKIDFNLEMSQNWNLDNPDLDRVFRDLGFRSLEKRAKNLSQKINRKNQMPLL